MKSDDRLHELIDKLEEVYIEDSTSDIRLLDAVKEVIFGDLGIIFSSPVINATFSVPVFLMTLS